MVVGVLIIGGEALSCREEASDTEREALKTSGRSTSPPHNWDISDQLMVVAYYTTSIEFTILSIR